VTISGAEEELLRLAEKAEIPVTATLMGLTAFPGTHPLFLGMLGMHGAVAANYAVTSCDLLIAVGARFDDRVTGQVSTFAPNARIVHLDIDPAEIGKNVRVDIPIVGDAKHILAALLSLLSAEKHEQWLKEVNKWKSNHPLVYQPHTDYIMPQAVVETILELTDGEAIICTEVGQNQMWAAQFYRFTRPRSFITSGGLGTMGFGFPAAIGAQVGNPERVVIDIAGDGSIQMNIQELATIASYQLPVKIIILNNGYLGMVRQWQEFFFEKRYSEVALNNPDFAKVAEAYGIKAYTVKKPEELKRMLTAVLNHPGPALLNCLVHPEENVLPMVPPNGSIHQMLGVGEV
jgi:acetolactate synthase-1/2/3 large subunit